MKNFLNKHWALIGFIIAFLLDQNTGFIEKIISDTFWQNLIKGIGSIVLAYFWKNQNNFLNQKQIRQKSVKITKK